MNEQDERINSSDGLGEAVLGKALSRSLTCLRRGECPDPEIMAMALDGVLENDARDLLMKHVSVCDICHETYLLAGELYGENNMEMKPRAVFSVSEGRGGERSGWSSRRWMALAASLLVATISLYVFIEYKPDRQPSSVPGKMTEDGGAFSSESIKSPETKVEDALMEETKNAPNDKDNAELAEKKNLTPPGDSTPPETLSKKNAMPAERSEMNRTDIKSKRKAPALTKFQPPEKNAPDQSPSPLPVKGDTPGAFRSKLTGRADAKQDSASLNASAPLSGRETQRRQESSDVNNANAVKREKPENKDNKNTDGLNEDEIQKKQEQLYFQKERAAQFSTAQNIYSAPASGSPAGPKVQQQVIQLKQRIAGTTGSYLNETQIRGGFRDAMQWVPGLRSEWRSLLRDGETAGNGEVQKAYIREVQPVMTAAVNKNGERIIPDFSWFLERSQPDSVDAQFFRLARRGWCDQDGFYYYRTESAGSGDGEWRALTPAETPAGDDKNVLLEEWRKLEPQLPSIYRSIARYSIRRLETAVK